MNKVSSCKVKYHLDLLVQYLGATGDYTFSFRQLENLAFFMQA